MQSMRGFSLIELMIVVSIISILAMIALPSYQNYTRRARFAEVISTASVFKTAVAIALQEGTPLHDIELGKAGIPDAPISTKNLASLKIENGMITATGTEATGSATYILKPSEDGSIFAIGGSCLQMGYCQ
jgi:prepilin-type N-terminal cleavage/methylation domain-containing protein